MNSNLVRSGILGVAAAAVVLLMSASAAAVSTSIQFCTTWRAQYADSSGWSSMEDWYSSTSAMDVHAQFSEYSIWEDNGDGTWSLIDRDWLTNYNSVYGRFCTSVRLLRVGKRYRFRQYTRLKRGEREIYMVNSSTSYTSPQRQYVDTDYIIAYSPNTQSKIGTPTTVSPAITATAVARQYLAVADNIGDTLNSNDKMYVFTDWTNCPNGSQYDSTKSTWMTNNLSPSGTPKHAICAPPGPDGSTSPVLEKFQVAHELGHGLAMIMGGPVPAGNSADTTGVFATGLVDQCTCDMVGGMSHCFQSREYIGGASGESFANFIAATLFNAREEDAWLGYYKKIYYNSVYTEYPTVWKNLGSQRKWMYDVCPPTSSDFGGLGVEWDWAQFYWQLWAHPNTGRFDMSDIFLVWQDTTDTRLCCSAVNNCYASTYTACTNAGNTWANFGKLWSHRTSHPSNLEYLVDAVGDGFGGTGSDKYLRFTSLGSQTGVNY